MTSCKFCFNGAGISGRIPTDAQLVASLTIAPDAPLGILTRAQIKGTTAYYRRN